MAGSCDSATSGASAGRAVLHLPDRAADEVWTWLRKGSLAFDRQVSPSTHRQALSALLFLYQKVLRQHLPWMQEIGRPQTETRLPVVLAQEEVLRVLAALDEPLPPPTSPPPSPSSSSSTPPGPAPMALLGRLLYGTGMRLLEGLRLRVKDVEFEQRAIVVREGKGTQDRVVMLPAALEAPLREQLARVHAVWQADRAGGLAGVHLPHALARKYPRASESWAWFWVFPQAEPAMDPRTGVLRRTICWNTPSSAPSSVR
jgi:site-specific recombinase XerD